MKLGKIRGERRERMKVLPTLAYVWYTLNRHFQDLASNRISDPLGMRSLNDLIEQSRQLHSHVRVVLRFFSAYTLIHRALDRSA